MKSHDTNKKTEKEENNVDGKQKQEEEIYLIQGLIIKAWFLFLIILFQNGDFDK